MTLLARCLAIVACLGLALGPLWCTAGAARIGCCLMRQAGDAVQSAAPRAAGCCASKGNESPPAPAPANGEPCWCCGSLPPAQSAPLRTDGKVPLICTSQVASEPALLARHSSPAGIALVACGPAVHLLNCVWLC